MPRRHRPEPRLILPDAKHGSVQVAKFINVVMRHGKKSVAERIVYDAMDVIKERTKQDPVEVIDRAIKNVCPQMEVKSRRVGGANYQVPVEVPQRRSLALAMRWLRDAMKLGGEKQTSRKLAREFIDASEERGMAFKKREDTHRMAAANRAFAHYRF